MKQWQKDSLYGVIICAVSLFFAHNTKSMQDGLIQFAAGRTGPYSRFWLYLLCVLGVILIMRAIIKRDQTVTKSALQPAALVTIAGMALYILGLEYLGFLVSTPIFLFALMVYYTHKAKRLIANEDGSKKSAKKTILSLALMALGAVLVTIATYLLFTKGVKMLLPEFKLFD